MRTITLGSEHMDRLGQLQQLMDSGVVPPEIAQVKEAIATRERLAHFRGANYGVYDPRVVEVIQEIVQLKLRLDNLYGAWLLGEL